MKLIDLTSQQQKTIKLLLECHLAHPSKVRLGIHEADQMYAHCLADTPMTAALVDYFSSGLKVFNAVKQVLDWHAGSIASVRSFLDFASGYGRFMRSLLSELAPERVWSSDIYGEAVAFQREYFGVNGFVSVTNPAEFPADRKYDCIQASSFFTHAPEKTFSAWLTLMYRLLNPEGGVLIFSVLDMSLASEKPSKSSKSLLYIPGSYDPELPAQDFGRTYVEESHIQNIINRVGEGVPGVRRIPLALDFLQDVYFVTNRADRWKSDWEFFYPPRVGCGVWEARSGGVQIEGWATDHYNVNGSIDEVRVIVNGEIVARCKPNIDRPDVAEKLKRPTSAGLGWGVSLPPETRTANDEVFIDAVNSRGLHHVMYAKPATD